MMAGADRIRDVHKTLPFTKTAADRSSPDFVSEAAVEKLSMKDPDGVCSWLLSTD
jgi:hypothetical protein